MDRMIPVEFIPMATSLTGVMRYAWILKSIDSHMPLSQEAVVGEGQVICGGGKPDGLCY